MLDERPELVNEAPYGDGWIVVIAARMRASSTFLDAQAYRALVEQGG